MPDPFHSMLKIDDQPLLFVGTMTFVSPIAAKDRAILVELQSQVYNFCEFLLYPSRFVFGGIVPQEPWFVFFFSFVAHALDVLLCLGENGDTAYGCLHGFRLIFWILFLMGNFVFCCSGLFFAGFILLARMVSRL